MATARQIESARRNGNKSTGPKTTEEKARSSTNALKHGLRSETPYVLGNEAPEQLRALFEACVRKFQPSDEFELEPVSGIAHARWRMRRFCAIETALLNDTMDAQAPNLAAEFEHLDEQSRLARAFAHLSDNHRSLHLVPRYEAHIRRNGERAVANLLKLRSASQPAEQPAAAHAAVPEDTGSAIPKTTERTGIAEGEAGGIGGNELDAPTH